MSKKEDNVNKNYLKKIKLLEEYNKFYYDNDAPIVSDQKYDDVKKKLLNWKKIILF